MGEQITDFLKGIRIEPKDLGIYQTAFTHRSFLNESKDTSISNERLEFLGDSILSYIISSHIYMLRPQDEEGELTNLRSYIIKTESLAKAAKELELGQLLRMSRGEAASGGQDNTQLLANTFEALLGAIFLDAGIEGATKFIHQTLLPLFAAELISGPPKDAKSQLQEVAQEKAKLSPRYRVLKTSGPDHAKKFMVGVYLNNKEVGKGQGSSKQQAEEEAAKQALTQLTKASI